MNRERLGPFLRLVSRSPWLLLPLLIGSTLPAQSTPRWLQQNQKEDGSWSSSEHGGLPGREVRATCTMMLSLLADGNTHRRGPFRKELRNSLRWLIKRQDETGLFTRKKDNRQWLSDQALATLVLALAMKKAQSKFALPRLQKAVRALEATFNPTDEQLAPEARVFATWAYLSAEGLGLKVNRPTMQRIREWVALEVASKAKAAAAKETKALEEASLLALRVLLAKKAEYTQLQGAVKHLLTQLSTEQEEITETAEPLAWFFLSWAGFYVGGKTWPTIHRQIKPLANRHSGNPRKDMWSGSWDQQGGDACTLALHCTMLTIYYRYCRLMP